MPEYPQLAREVTSRRKRGDLDGAIELFKASAETDRRMPEVRAALAWVIYDRDIKPIAPAAQKADPTLNVTEKMARDAMEAVPKIRTWCQSDPYSKFSAYPTAYLAVARILRGVEMHTELRELLESEDPTRFLRESDGNFPSHQSQWANQALDVVKHLLAPATATRQRVLSAGPLLMALARVNAQGGLSRECPEYNDNGKKRKLPSQKQRFILQYTRFLQEAEQHDELITVCRSAINSRDFEHSPNLKWVLYRLAQVLKDRDPKEALKVCDDFVALEYRTYALLLRAEILLACGDQAGALREVTHSLQIISENDLPFITKNLMFLASLTEDVDIQKLHVRMARAIRIDQGRAPNAEIEAMAAELGLGESTDAPSAKELRAVWDRLNPEPKRRQAVGRAIPTRDKGRNKSFSRARFKADESRFGEIVIAKIPTKDGTSKFRPVVIIGQDNGDLLVGPLQTASKHVKAIQIQQWEQAGLPKASLFVPYFHIVAAEGLRTTGHLTDHDVQRIRTVC